MDGFALIGYDISCEFGDVVKADIMLSAYGNDIVSIEELRESLELGYLPTVKSVVECPYCGQWGVRKTSCKYCGGIVYA